MPGISSSLGNINGTNEIETGASSVQSNTIECIENNNSAE